jgi:ElaB/YqjD/DUF883 family membrane-anchored ribosome-binding protein
MNRQPDIAETAGNGHGKSTLGAAGTADLKSAVARSSKTGELQNFIADIEDLITSMTSLTGEDLERTKEKLAERVDAAKQALTETGNQIAERARQSARVTNSYVHEHPWQAVGIGAIFGLLVGIAVNRRN